MTVAFEPERACRCPDPGGAGARGTTRRRPRRPGTRPRQPHRRAHRLQPGPRPAGRDRPRDPHRLPPDRRPTGPASDASMTTRPTASTSTTPRPRAGTWLDYVAGTAWALTEAGLPLTGLRGVIASTLPPNAGLSSSAAIELASAWALLDDAAPGVDPFSLAQICQRAENGYVGVQSGLMDQFASSCGVADAAVLLDCRSLDWRAIPLPAEVVLVVCHTGSTHHLGELRVQPAAEPVRCRRGRPGRHGPGHPEPARRHARSPRRGSGPARPGRLPARHPRRHRERPGRGDGGRPRRRRSAGHRSPLRREPCLVARPVRGQLPGARRDGRHRLGACPGSSPPG